MFTGIVEECGTLISRKESRIRIGADMVLCDAFLGASIAVNGCCLTVVSLGDGYWEADVVDETFARTSLGTLRVGDRVNLERPLRADGRFGGHIVQGHIDGVGVVTQRAPDLRVQLDQALLAYVVEKGSITLDGVSLTVAQRHETSLSVAIIPHTAQATTLGERNVGDPVNIEVDVVAKYVAALVTPYGAGMAEGVGT